MVAKKNTSCSSWRRRSKARRLGERHLAAQSLRNLPLASSGALAWATTYSSSSSAVR